MSSSVLLMSQPCWLCVYGNIVDATRFFTHGSKRSTCMKINWRMGASRCLHKCNRPTADATLGPNFILAVPINYNFIIIGGKPYICYISLLTETQAVDCNCSCWHCIALQWCCNSFIFVFAYHKTRVSAMANCDIVYCVLCMYCDIQEYRCIIPALTNQ